MVLARAHDMLTTENWEGGYLREIVSRAINPHAIARERRFVLSGPELKIPPKMALAIAIALHELAASSVPGRIRLSAIVARTSMSRPPCVSRTRASLCRTAQRGPT